MTSAQQPGLLRWHKWLIYTAITVGVLALVWSQLPRSPYSTDLTRIGQGQPALVLAYDIQSMGGMAVMAMMDDLREEYADRIAFLVAPLGAPHGQAFGRRFEADNGSVVLFSATGAATETVHLPQNTAELKKELDKLLARPVE
ncbi:hypothetical protein [Limnohabitans sp.]|jgi:hypothetical protein|uniref:hypothetical protein n=1 Tax=Limnohabitans sp. TaxID=1907725 RepID=UPI0037C07585